jgi:hypothetical protein
MGRMAWLKGVWTDDGAKKRRKILTNQRLLYSVVGKDVMEHPPIAVAPPSLHL